MLQRTSARHLINATILIVTLSPLAFGQQSDSSDSNSSLHSFECHATGGWSNPDEILRWKSARNRAARRAGISLE